jgi:tRNA modification GTPase
VETIFALASASGKAGVAVIRISGPGAHLAVSALCALPAERYAALRDLVWKGEVVDQALVLIFGAGRSFTGEAMAELQVHGSGASVSAVTSALRALGLRMAEPGEFTRRALMNGKLDLAQVEGLADLIEAETDAQRRQAMCVLSGSLGEKVDAIKTHLVRASALIVALIDFSSEDLPDGVLAEINTELKFARGMLATEAAGVRAAERIRDGFEIAIVGAPNVGKSSLLNYLAGREAAITSEIAGTTRDVIEVRMDIEGLAVTLLDTAGLRDGADPIEAIGISRARERAERADLRLILVGADDGLVLDPRPGDVICWTKSDISEPPSRMLSVSTRTGAGVPLMLSTLHAELSQRTVGAGAATRARHRDAMQRAIQALDVAEIGLMQGESRLEIVAEDVRVAVRALDSLVGRVDVEDLLDHIFASFCIGK